MHQKIMELEKKLKHALDSNSKEKIKSVFSDIYYAYSKLLAFVVGEYIKDNDSIKDIVNDAFVIFFNNADKVKGSIKAYLVKIARNEAIDFLKKTNNICELNEDITASNEPQSSNSYKNIIEDLKSVLTDMEIKVVILHIIDELPFKDIGEKLNITANNANVIYFRAIKKFKTSKKGQEYEKERQFSYQECN